MGIEDFKRWHWCVIGVFVGAMAATISLYSGPTERVGTDSVGPQVLEEQLLQRKDPSRRMVADVRNVRVHPASEMPLPGTAQGETDYATYDVLLRRHDDPVKCDIAHRRMILQLHNPKQPSIAGNIDGLTARQYLQKLRDKLATLDKAKFPLASTFSYKFSWIETPRGAYPVYTLGGFVLIGLIWPSVVGFLISAGYGRGKSSDDEFDLSKYRSSSSGKTAAERNRAAVTDADLDQLAKLEAELEAKLKSGEVGAVTAGDAKTAAPAKPTVRVLSAGPLEGPKEAAIKPHEVKGFGADQGDYYPTEVHGKKKS
ncbi:MAG TPA: hypothetical protein VH475_15455 [Tepidisphaeraceae bacterium]